MKKRVLSILLVLAMLIGMMPVQVFATEESETPETIAVESIALDQTEATVAAGGTITLTATVQPENATDKTVAWNSDNTEVASVADGVVTGVTTGTATITAAAGGQTASCTVTVEGASNEQESVNHAPTLKRGESASASAKVGEAYTLALTDVFYDEDEGDTLTYTVSVNGADAVEAAASYSYTPDEAGEVKLVFTASDGQESISYTVTLTVEAADATVAVTEVTLDKTELELEEGETATLNAAVVPEDATDKTVEWTSSNDKVATVENGVVTAVSEGTATIKATAGSYIATCAVTVNAAEEELDPNWKILTFEGSEWDKLIDSPQYGGSLLYGDDGFSGFSSEEEAYTWTDSETKLTHTMPENYGGYCYWGGGHAISHYASGDVATYGGYESQLTVYKSGVTGLATSGGGHNGSNNFAVHFGYIDGSEWNTTENLPAISFSDGVARVIDHMYVNTTTYLDNCILDGNNLTSELGENETVWVSATGYDANGNEGKTIKFILAKGSDVITEWTKWDLSGLGAVTRVEFNMGGESDNGYGFSQPAYFAYDDVAVVFETETACTHAETTTAYTQVEGTETHTVTVTCDSCNETVGEVTTEDCVDEDKDGKCDVCGGTVEVPCEHTETTTAYAQVEGTETHTVTVTCDSCNETVGEVTTEDCVDEDKDGQCDVCGGTVEVLETTILTECVKKAGNWDGWLKSITVTGVKIDQYAWAGGGSGHDETSDADHTLYIQLSPDVADDATIALSYALGGNTGYMKYASTPPASVTLVDGTATVKVTTQYSRIASWVTTRNYTIIFTNKPNVLPEPTTEELSADLFAANTYELDLSQYFTDENGDTLTYTVSVNGADAVAADAPYSYVPTTVGTHTLVFTANDGWGDSEKTLTVTLNVTNSTVTYDVNVTAPEGYTLAFQAVSVISGGSVSTSQDLEYTDGVVKVPENVSIITWTCDGAVCGTASVSADSTLNIQALSFGAKTVNDQMDDASTFTVTDANGCTVTVGESGVALLASGSGYTFTATPSSTYSGSWSAVTLSEQTVSDEAAASVTLVYTLKSAKSITAPAGAEVHVYYQTANYAGYGVDAAYSTEDTENDTVTYYYACTNEQTYTKAYVYRATYGEDKITKAGFMNSVTDVVLTWSDDDATPSYRGSKNIANYVYSSSKIYRSGDGLYMNLNTTGHLVLTGDATKDLGAFRTWNIINSDTTNVTIEPDFHFTVVAGDDVISLTDLNSAFGNNWQRIGATGEGTAFLEVTYDAIQVVDGYEAGAWGGAFAHISGYTYNAVDPSTTGLVVVQTDGNAASDVTFNIASDISHMTYQWDAEIDTYYITGKTGTLNLAPTATSGIQSVAVSNDKGANWTTLTGTDEGVYTATVVPGNNVIRVTNANGQTAYQVVRVVKLGVTVQNLTDSSKGSKFDAGDSVRVIFDGLIAPVYKMGGIYNPSSTVVVYTDEDGNTYKTNGTNYSFGAAYSYNGNDYYYTSFDVTIPESGELTLNAGYITVGGYSITPGAHRGITMSGVGQNTGATTGGSTRSVLPALTLGAEAYAVNVVESENGAVTADVTEAKESDTVTLTVTPATGYALDTLTVTDAEGNEVIVTDNTFTMPASNVTVKATFKAVKTVDVTLSGIHSAQISTMKLYTYTNGVKGETDLLDGLETTYDSSSYTTYYSLELAPGEYWVEGYSTYNDETYYNGGISLTITDEESQTYKVQRMYQLYATNSGWVEDTDYEISVVVTDANKNERVVELGTNNNYGTIRTSCLFVVGDTVSATFTPIGERAELCLANTVSKTSTYNDYISAKISETLLMTFTVPEGSTVDVGRLEKTYFVYTFFEAEGEPADGEEEGTEVWTYKVPKETVNVTSGPYFFYRVRNDEGITYWRAAPTAASPCWHGRMTPPHWRK